MSQNNILSFKVVIEGANVSVTQEAGNPVEPVSYTHLDVYKRQLWTAPAHVIGNVRE